MLQAIAELILNAETNHSRFEKFAADMCSRSEGKTFVPTSQTYDRGRDARSLERSRGTHADIVCATLNTELDEKVITDVKRLAETSTPDRVIYCTSQHVTEDKVDKLLSEVRPMLPPGCSISILGSIQLAALSDRFNDVFERHYSAEVRTIDASLRSFEEPPDENRTSTTRLALLAFGSADAGQLRTVMSRNAVLTVLREQNTATVAQVAKRLSDDLHLSRVLSTGYVSDIVKTLADEQLLRRDGDVYCLTDKGRTLIDAIPSEAAKELLAGSKLIRERLEELTGVTFSNSQFESIWTTLLDFFAEAFYSNGLNILHAVREIIAPESEPAQAVKRLQDLIEAGARKVRTTISEGSLADDVEQAVLDMFNERSGPAFEWLARVCERFVALCALGLESSTADEVRSILRRQLIVIDSDILLTLLCESEPDHRPAKDLLARWRQLGGRILVAIPVLSEVATHAWIAEREFKETLFLLGKLRPEELRRYASNAFVRAFHFRAGARGDAKNWTRFIEQYRGASSTDYSPLLDLLRDELGVELLSDSYEVTVKEEIADYLRTMVAGFRGVPVAALDKAGIDKADRDGVLLASIAMARQAQQKAGSGNTVVLLSSSIRLRRADNRFRNLLGSPLSVMALGPFSYLLSLLPNVVLGAGTLRRALFEFGATAHLPDTERVALQIIRGSDSFDMPWAKRRGLQRSLEKVLFSEAAKRGVTVNALKRQFEAGDESIKPAEIIVEALKESAVSDTTTLELREAKQTIVSLQARVEQLETQVRARRTQRELP